jgi:hypothetical protein
VLRRKSILKTEEVRKNLRKLHYKELHNVYSALNTVRVTKSRQMRWEVHAERMAKMENT